MLQRTKRARVHRLNIIHLALRTEYSFKKVFGHLSNTIEDHNYRGYVGVADMFNTHSFPKIEMLCAKLKDKKIKPIYGVRVTAAENPMQKIAGQQGSYGKEYIVLAKNENGLREIYQLVKKGHDNFYYRANINYFDLHLLSDDVIVICKSPIEGVRCDYLQLSQDTRKKHVEESGLPVVAIVENYYPSPEYKDTYDIFTSPRDTDIKTFPQHIMSTKEFRRWMYLRGFDRKLVFKAIKNTHVIAKECAGIKLPKAPMIRHLGKETVESVCEEGAARLGINLEDPTYKKRYEYELELIKKLNFQDYFLVVSGVVMKAKQKMLVGPGRGSSGGSLICYLMGITELDPIKFGLFFERFVDINRDNLPDIDIDFPDSKRDLVVKDTIKTFGKENVAHVGTISTMKPHAAINEWAKFLKIPDYETDELKNSIIIIKGGDTRSNNSFHSAIENSETAQEFFRKFPQMESVKHIENHSRHQGVHAAGLIVCNDPLVNYTGVNTRDDVIMCEKYGAEYLNLLKIDILGLRTLSVIESCCDQIGMDYEDVYKIWLEDPKVFKIFTDVRLDGIFQFEGYSLTQLTRQMDVESFEDVVAITSLARPGALYGGGALRFIKRRNGEDEVEYVGKEHEDITKDTYGIVVYQEQVLRFCREIGQMDWDVVNMIRKSMQYSWGKEFVEGYRIKFHEGAQKLGYSKEDCDFLWSEIEGSGSYAFNRSHAVAYAMISYWTAYMKAYHPLEFVAANLRHAKNDDSALKILRDAFISEGIEYVPVDADLSEENWSVKDGKIIGGLVNVNGIGPANAKKIIKARTDSSVKIPRSVMLKLFEPETAFDILFPTKHYWGHIQENPRLYGLKRPVSNIIDIQGKGDYIFIGRLLKKNIRDLNEYKNLQRRGGEELEEHSLSLAIILEDDTDRIMCNVNRFRYEQIGREIAETAVEEKDWFIVQGKIKWNGRYIDIEDITKLDESLLEL